MKAPAADPDANAVYLSYDEDDDDLHNVHRVVVRLKILTQAAVAQYADVQVGTTSRHFAIQDVEARTVHADGTVIPFTGKPFVKTVRIGGESYKATVFSMPDVQVGSILEYRYRLGYDDNYLLPARWYLQHTAYVLREHYAFHPFDDHGGFRTVLLDHGQISQGLFYVSALPNDAKIVPNNGPAHPYYEVSLTDVPAIPDEDALPPLNSLTYRMLFYYAAQLKASDYWSNEGKYLSKDMNSFAAAGPKIKADVATLTVASDSPEVKARKLYAATMKLENTDYTREHAHAEDVAQGLKTVKTAEDIWTRQRGSSDEIALTYLALLRAAGLQAYGMRLTDRAHNLFEPNLIDTTQLDADIVIAEINGKEVYLDPGAQFCPFGQLAWQHSWAHGVRQTEHGSELAESAPLNYKDNVALRIANLGLDETGEGSGTVTLVYFGQQGMQLRQREVGEAPGDTNKHFEEQLRGMMPGGTKLHVISIQNLSDGEKPLQVTFGVSGPVATSSGHRMFVSEALLRSNEAQTFTKPTRKNPVYFQYPYALKDVVTLKLAEGLKLEALPQAQKAVAMDTMAYNLEATSKGDTLQLTRSVALNGVILPPSDYPQLRKFFGDLRSADEGQVLLVRSPAAPAAASPAATAIPGAASPVASPITSSGPAAGHSAAARPSGAGNASSR